MRKNYSYLILTILPILAISLPISFENTYQASGMIYPYKELTILDDQGKYSIDYNDRLHPENNYSFQQEPERGDIQQLEFSSFTEGDLVGVGDTLLKFFSSLKSERISSLLGQLEVEKSNLEVLSTGEKNETRDRVTSEYGLAKNQYEIAKNNYDRVVPLAAEGYLSQIELARYERDLREAEGQLQIIDKKIVETATGQKRELISMSLSNIKRLELELSTLNKTIDRLIIESPLNGIYKRSQFAGYIAGVENRDTLVYLFPITQDKLQYIEVGKEIHLEPFGYDKTITARIVKIGNHAKMVENLPSLMVTAIIVGNHDLPSGSLAKAEVVLGEQNFWEYITSNSR